MREFDSPHPLWFYGEAMAREHSGGLYRVKCKHCPKSFLGNTKAIAEKAKNDHEKTCTSRWATRGVEMPIRKAVDRVLVYNRKTKKRKLVKVKKRVVDQWGDAYDFPVSVEQATAYLLKKGVLKDGMIVIEYWCLKKEFVLSVTLQQWRWLNMNLASPVNNLILRNGFVKSVDINLQEIFHANVSKDMIEPIWVSSIAGVLSMADGASHKGLVEGSTPSPGTWQEWLAEYIAPMMIALESPNVEVAILGGHARIDQNVERKSLKKGNGEKMAKWHEDIAKALGSRHSDFLALVRAGKNGAKKRSSRRERRKAKKNINE
jgi:hypothetical protein